MKDLKSIIKSDSFGKLIFGTAILAIVLIFISDLFGKESPSSSLSSTQQADSDSEYVTELESKVRDIVCAITGSDDAKVMITLESSTEYVYASEKKSATDVTENSESNAVKSSQKDNTEDKYIIIEDSEGNEQALLITELTPKIRGVVIICRGGSEKSVSDKITTAVTTALAVSSKKVCVTG